jgi:hypothetical protein
MILLVTNPSVTLKTCKKFLGADRQTTLCKRGYALHHRNKPPDTLHRLLLVVAKVFAKRIPGIPHRPLCCSVGGLLQVWWQEAHRIYPPTHPAGWKPTPQFPPPFRVVGFPFSQGGFCGSATTASRLPSLRSALRGLDPAVPEPKSLLGMANAAEPQPKYVAPPDNGIRKPGSQERIIFLGNPAYFDVDL